VPSTSIANLLFVLSNHFTVRDHLYLSSDYSLPTSQTLAHDHFGRLDIDFLDLFLPVRISSLSRARVFLWLAFHYHEAPSANPFDDDHARQNVGFIPKLAVLSEEEFEQENVDPEDERDYATKMTKLRMEFLAKNAQTAENNNPKDRKGITKLKTNASSPGKSVPTKRERSDADSLEDPNTDQVDRLSSTPPCSCSQNSLPNISSRPSFAEKKTQRSDATRNPDCAFRFLNV
jgi:Ino eighty subunit 1